MSLLTTFYFQNLVIKNLEKAARPVPPYKCTTEGTTKGRPESSEYSKRGTTSVKAVKDEMHECVW